MTDLIHEKIAQILSECPHKLIISNPRKINRSYKKIEIVQKGDYYQASQYTDKQVFHKNMSVSDLESSLIMWMKEYSQLNAWGEKTVYELKISKKDKVFLHRKTIKEAKEISQEHNRKKNYILKEGTVILPLVDMGIFTKSGQIVRSMYDKYKQINRFIEMIDDTVKDKTFTSLTVIDFGCGKSYLTFVLYYYFTEIKNIDVKIIGLDLKEEVIKNCNLAARKYGYAGLTFELGDINGYSCDFPVDMVITLHACDTATDYALYHAIAWEAKMILAAPCCQHELNGQMKSERLSALTRYGVVKERIAALMTDAIRGNILEVYGYKTQLLEFIDFQHSPKNIMIRGIKSNTSQNRKDKYAQEVRNLLAEFGVSPTLCELLNFQ